MTFFCYKDKTGQWKWYLKNAHDKKIAESSGGYWCKEDCLRTIDQVRETNKYTYLVDMEREHAKPKINPDADII